MALSPLTSHHLALLTSSMRLALIQNHCSPDRDENLGRALNSMEQAKERPAVSRSTYVTYSAPPARAFRKTPPRYHPVRHARWLRDRHPPGTARVTPIGMTGFRRIGAMDVHPTTGVLYAAAQRQSDNAAVLVTLDPTTGVGTEIGVTGVAGSISGMSFHSNGTLYGHDASPPPGIQTLHVQSGDWSSDPSWAHRYRSWRRNASGTSKSISSKDPLRKVPSKPYLAKTLTGALPSASRPSMRTRKSRCAPPHSVGTVRSDGNCYPSLTTFPP